MKNTYLLVLGLFCTFACFAQQTTNSTGGTGQAGNIILDWSVGELTLVNTVQSGNFVLTQGLLQGRLIAFSVSGTISSGEMTVTPNPTPGLLYINEGFLEPGQLHLRLFDARGRLLIERETAINSFSTETMNLTMYASDMYLLEAVFTPTNGTARKRTYKILRLP